MSQDKNNPAKHIFKVIGVLLLSFEYFCNIHFCTGSTSLASKIPKSFSSFQDFERTSLQLKECASGYISVKGKETFLFSLQHRHALSVYPHFVGRYYSYIHTIVLSHWIFKIQGPITFRTCGWLLHESNRFDVWCDIFVFFRISASLIVLNPIVVTY